MTGEISFKKVTDPSSSHFTEAINFYLLFAKTPPVPEFTFSILSRCQQKQTLPSLDGQDEALRTIAQSELS